MAAGDFLVRAAQPAGPGAERAQPYRLEQRLELLVPGREALVGRPLLPHPFRLINLLIRLLTIWLSVRVVDIDIDIVVHLLVGAVTLLQIGVLGILRLI